MLGLENWLQRGEDSYPRPNPGIRYIVPRNSSGRGGGGGSDITEPCTQITRFKTAPGEICKCFTQLFHDVKLIKYFLGTIFSRDTKRYRESHET